MTTHTFGPYTFQWTSLHIDPDESERLKYKCDELGSKTVQRLQAIAKQKNEKAGGAGLRQMDLYALLKDHSDDEQLSEFWKEINTVPEWVDWEQLARGQKFFYRYAVANIMGFALQGFMGENSAAKGISEVLVRTGGFSTRKLFRRLLETFQFLLQVTEHIESIQPGENNGFITTVRVRLLHSMVRTRIQNLAATKDDYWDTQELGLPINTIGSIHAICTFSCNHSWLQLPFMGIYPTEQETSDYIALFRYLGYLLGTPHEYFETTARAKATMESMLVNELRITPTSDVVAHNFIQCLTDLPPFNISTQFIEAGSRVLNGDRFCDQLKLGQPGFVAYASFRGCCWLSKSLAYVQSASPWIDEMVIAFVRSKLHELVILSKGGLDGGSKLEFKHIPQIGKMVGKEDHNRPILASAVFTRPVESFFLGVYICGLALIGGIIASMLMLARSCSVRNWL